jgi:transcription elongation factor GreB
MGRYRTPAPRGSKYITRAGAERLRRELDALWREERPRVTQAVQAAAAQGDRSENADYTYGKRRLREIDGRVRFLRKRLEGMVVVEQAPADPRRVFFGAWVVLEAQDGTRSRHRIVAGRVRTWPRATSAWIPAGGVAHGPAQAPGRRVQRRDPRRGAYLRDHRDRVPG